MPFWPCQKCNGSGLEYGFWRNCKDFLTGKPITKCSVCFGDQRQPPPEKPKLPPSPRPPLTTRQNNIERILRILENKH